MSFVLISESLKLIDGDVYVYRSGGWVPIYEDVELINFCSVRLAAKSSVRHTEDPRFKSETEHQA